MALLPFEAALGLVLEGVEATSAEPVALAEASDRVLARDLEARLTQPPVAVSAMDGYAVRAADLMAGTSLRLRVIGQSAAGRGLELTVGPGEAARIFTGAGLPAGADAILIQEDVTRDGDSIAILGSARCDPEHIRAAGLDFTAGQCLLTAGRRLDPRALMLAAAMGYASLPVRRRPSVAILATGDELVPPADFAHAPAQVPAARPGHRIVASNPVGLAAMAAAVGASIRDLGIAPDTAEALDAKLAQSMGYDILVTIGGASVGDYDLVRAALERRGAVVAFAGVAMRPGKPTMLSRLGDQRILSVSGNPASAYLAGRLFLVPLILKMLGARETGLGTRAACLAHALPANGPRRHTLRANLAPGTAAGGLPIVTVTASQDSALMSVLADADSLIVRAPDAPSLPAGAVVDILACEPTAIAPVKNGTGRHAAFNP